MYLQLAPHRPHHHLHRHYPQPCRHLHRKRDPLNLKLRTIAPSLFQLFLFLTSTCSNIAITPTTIQDPKITLPSTFHTTASSSTFPSPCCSTSLSPSSISVFDKTRQGSPNTFSIQKKITAKTTLSSGSSTSSISSPTTLQNSSSSFPRPRSRITTSYTSIQSKFHPHT